ncbi:methionine ABC transporter substrate-binding protein [Collibacillus ludicampi]|uniref:Lipoprotein n=1 Tax=Collibacillus ludicampi TaxID=2771369 RepID=A0AAV4LHA1_9BACL|nr:methionine ABC transporter substrate-binding protein [Collibacillus ludicampi]
MLKKKWLLPAASLVLAMSLTACGQAKKDEAAPTKDSGKEVTLKVGASAVPHAEILNYIKPKLKQEGVELDVKVFNDYVQPNIQLNEKQLDANFFQHIPYLEQFNKDHNMNLVDVAKVHIEPMGVYTKKGEDIKKVKDGATISVPNDATNEGRALKLLEKAGVFQLDDTKGYKVTPSDIKENPHHVQIKPLEAAMLPRTIDDVDFAVINTNYALQANLNPTKDAVFIEGKDSPFANVLVTRQDNKDSEAIKKLVQELNSPDVKKYIEDHYKGAIVPAF